MPSIHPIAGQGLNLGLRDATMLADSMNESKRLGLQYSDITILNDYSQKRTIDKNLLVQATHRLNNFFSNDSLFFLNLEILGLRCLIKSLLKNKACYLQWALRTLTCRTNFKKIFPTIYSCIMTITKSYF